MSGQAQTSSEPYSRITGVILAGGKSSRMGSDKALLEFNGKPFIRHIYEVLSQVFEQVCIVSDHSEKYHFLNARTFPDTIKNAGPLGGIHSALTHIRNDFFFVVSCDLPLITPEAIRYILSSRGGHSVVVYNINGKIQPLCGLYAASVLPILTHCLASGQYSVTKFLQHIDAVVLDCPVEIELGGSLTNMNTPDEYRRALRRYRLPENLPQ